MFEYYKYNESSTLNIHNSKKMFIFIVCLVVMIFIILFCYNYKVRVYLQTKLLVSCNQECLYYMYVTDETLTNVTDAKNIKINKNNYPYEIKNIGDMMYNQYSLSNYMLVEIALNLPNKYQVDNLILDVEVLLKEEKLIEIIKETIWKE